MTHCPFTSTTNVRAAKLFPIRHASPFLTCGHRCAISHSTFNPLCWKLNEAETDWPYSFHRPGPAFITSIKRFLCIFLFKTTRPQFSRLFISHAFNYWVLKQSFLQHKMIRPMSLLISLCGKKHPDTCQAVDVPVLIKPQQYLMS